MAETSRIIGIIAPSPNAPTRHDAINEFLVMVSHDDEQTSSNWQEKTSLSSG